MSFKTTIKESIEKITKRYIFADYDFIRLFLASLVNNNELYISSIEELRCLLYGLSLKEEYHLLFQDTFIKEQINNNSLDIDYVLREARSTGLILNAINMDKITISIDLEYSKKIISSYKEIYQNKMDSLVKELIEMMKKEEDSEYIRFRNKKR